MVDKNIKLVPQSVSSVDDMKFVTNEKKVTGCLVTWTINYGKLSMPITADIWGELNATQRGLVQSIYDKLVSYGGEFIEASQ